MTKAKTFEWNEETTALVVELYQASVEKDGLESANTNDSLGKIANESGAKSAQAVRQKLVKEKVYEKTAQPRKVGGKVKTQKVHYIKALEKIAEEHEVDLGTGRKLDSLEQATAAALASLIEMFEAVTTEKIVVNPEDAETEA